MSCSKVFKVLVMALAINICYAANIRMSRGEISTTTTTITEEPANPQQLMFEKDSNGGFNSADNRVQMCKTSCVQKCLENRKLLKTSDDRISSNNDSLQTEENDVMKKDSQRQSQLAHEQCLGGCTEACSFYKRLLIMGNEHTKSSFVTGDSVISQQTTQKSASSSPVSDYISSTSIPATSASAAEHENAAVVDSSVTTDKRLGGEDQSFELRLASLIHQKSLVIAELKWDDIGGIPNQAYLVTWEMTDGGLKGHLVTDSSSVTLSLWPGTTYRIQVQQFKPMLEADGSQPPETSTLKSVPLEVDTSEASFPLGRSSPLFSNEEANDYNLEEHSLYHEEDEYAQDGNEMEEEEEEEENEDHKSNEGLHSMTSLLGVSLCATVLVIVLLSLTAFTWLHFQTLRKVECFSCCFTSDEEPQLLSHEDLSDVLCTEKATATTGKSLKFYGMPSFFGSSKEYKVAGLLESDVPISSICSGSPAPHSVLHCSLDNAWSKGTPYEPTTTATIPSMKENASAQDRISSISELVSDNVQQ